MRGKIRVFLGRIALRLLEDAPVEYMSKEERDELRELRRQAEAYARGEK